MDIRHVTAACVLWGIVPLTSPSVSCGEIAHRATVTPASSAQARQQAPLLAFLQEYFTSLAQGDVERLTSYRPALTGAQRDLLREYFAYTVRDLHIDIRDVQVQLATNTATVTFLRTDHFVDRVTGRQIKKSIRLSAVLEYGGSGWGWPREGLAVIAFALGGRTGQAR
jgi:hypothetical protein